MISTSNINIKSVKYISLKKDFIRRFLLRTLLCNLKCEKKWIPGVTYDGKNPVHKAFLKNGCQPYLKGKMHQHRQKGVVGCWIAHTNALEDIKEEEGLTVILEDDFVCQRGFFTKAVNMLREFDQVFDIVIFDPHGSGPLSEHCIGKDIYLNGGTWPEYWGSHFLFINNENVPKIIEAKRNSPISDYDGFLTTNTELKIYLFYSRKCTTINFGSNILRTSKAKDVVSGIFNWMKHRFSTSDYLKRVY